jgi:hypothetical protein
MKREVSSGLRPSPVRIAVTIVVAAGLVAAVLVAARRRTPTHRILAAMPAPGAPYTRPCDNDPTVPWPSVVLVPPINGMDGVEESDFDHDGDPDFLVPAEQSNHLFVGINPGPGSITAGGIATVILSTSLANAEGACWVDANDDGWDDAIGLPQAPGDVPMLCLNPGAGGDPHDAGDWVCADMTNFGGGGYGFMQCARGDWNKDGVDDALIGGNVHTNPGQLLFVPGPITATSTGTLVVVTGRTMAIGVGDFDGDTNPDAIVTDREAATGATPGLFVLWGNGDGTFTRVNISVGTGSVRMLFRLGDLDGNGEAFDLCSGVDGQPWSGMCWIHRSGTRIWRPRVLPDPHPTGLWTSSDIGDINLDGYPDVAVMFDSSSSEVGAPGQLWIEGPLVTWMYDYRHALDTTGIKLDIGKLRDYDGDGDVDLVNTEQNVGGSGTGRGLVLHLNPCL